MAPKAVVEEDAVGALPPATGVPCTTATGAPSSALKHDSAPNDARDSAVGVDCCCVDCASAGAGVVVAAGAAVVCPPAGAGAGTSCTRITRPRPVWTTLAMVWPAGG